MDFLEKVDLNTLIVPMLSVFVTMYGPRLQPNLPNKIMKLLNNKYFRFIVILLITYLSSKSLQQALIITVIFLFMTSLSTTQESFENAILPEKLQNLLNCKNLESQECVNYCYSEEGENDEFCKNSFPKEGKNCINIKNAEEKLNCLKNVCIGNNKSACKILNIRREVRNQIKEDINKTIKDEITQKINKYKNP